MGKTVSRAGGCRSAWRQRTQLWLALVLLQVLGACGGGGGSSSVQAYHVEGVAAVGAAIQGGQVQVRCVAGVAQTGRSTASDGSFRVVVDGLVPPCMVQVSGGTVDTGAGVVANASTVHGYAAQAGTAHATVLTELVLARALGAAPVSVFERFDGSSSTAPTAAALRQALVYVGDQFEALGLGRPDEAALNGRFAVGDTNDRLMDALGSQLAAAGLGLDSLVTASQGDGTWAPLVTQRPCASAELAWDENGRRCSALAVAGASGSSQLLTDTSAPDTGQASFSCQNGSWSVASAATCSPPPPQDCAGRAVTWSVNNTACLADLPATASGASVLGQDSTAPATGSARFSCSDGQWSAASDAACSAPRDCAAQPLTWSVGAASCEAAVAAQASGVRSTVIDAVAPATGQAAFVCQDGRWLADGTATCRLPAACSAQALSWTVGGQTCSATVAAAASGSSAVLSDVDGSSLGGASFTCQDGQWSAPGQASCRAVAACTTATLGWTEAGQSCSAQVLGVASGLSSVATDSTGPATGSAAFSCSDGQWSAASQAVCRAPAACSAQTLGWTVNGRSCSASVPTAASGASVLASDTTQPDTGSASFSCSNGVWSAASSASCNPPAQCSGQTMTWSVAGNTCSAALPTTSAGSSATATDSTAPVAGSAVFTCNQGSWSAASHATCQATLPERCSAQTLNWTVGASSCSAAVPDTVSGGSTVATDATAPTTGSASFACLNGSWGAASNASCSQPAASCGSQALGWSVNGVACSAVVASTASGGSVVVTDSSQPATGSASFSCSNGQWSTAGSASCSLPAACPAQTLTWTVDGNSCHAAVAEAASGSSAMATDASAPATGSASFSCSNGQWSAAASGASCSVPAACSAQTLAWRVNQADCSAAVPATASGLRIDVSDTSAPSTGNASFTCSDGQWSTASQASCTVPANCSAQTLTWVVNGNSCSGQVADTSAGGSATATDSTAPATGVASFSCSNGSWGSAQSASCNQPAACSAQSLTWAVNGNSCSALAPATASGGQAVVSDVVGPATGSASYSCSNGVWGSPSAASCSLPPACSAQTLSWTVGGSTCSAAATATASGAASSLTDTGLPSVGQAVFACNTGQWSGAAAGATCSLPPQGVQSLSLNLQAAAGGRFYEYASWAFAELGRAWNGNAQRDGFYLLSGLPGHVTVGSGVTVMPCGGTWNRVATVSYDLTGYTGSGAFTAPVTAVVPASDPNRCSAAQDLAGFARVVADDDVFTLGAYTTRFDSVSGQVRLQDGVVVALALESNLSFVWTNAPGVGTLTFSGTLSVDSSRSGSTPQFRLDVGAVRTTPGLGARWDFSGSVSGFNP